MMGIIDKIKNMSMDEFAHICNRLVAEMGFKINNSVYRGDTVVMDASMSVPGELLRYVIIFLRKEKLTRKDVEEIVDFESLKIRWMLITTGEVDEEARKILPENMEVNILDGREFESMLREFGVAESLEEKKPSGISYLPSVGEIEKYLQWAEEFLKNGNHEKALDYVNNAIKIKPTPRAIKLKGRILYEMGKHDEALSIIKEVLEGNVKDDESWFILGNILEGMKRLDEAEESYSQCIRFNPRNIGCWINRGNLMVTQEKYDEALLCFENALKVRQDLPAVWNNRGVVLKQLKKYDEAMRSYNAALKFDPQFAEAYLNKAYLFYDMRRYEEAENAIRQYLKLENDVRGYLLLSNVYMKRKMLHEAEEYARKVLEMDPTNMDARKILRRISGGKAKELEKDVKMAIDDLLRTIPEEEFGDIRKIIEEARDYSLKGDIEKARDKLEEAREKIEKHRDEEKMRGVIIEDIITLSEELNEVPPENVDEMSLDELKKYRKELIKKLEGKKSEKDESKKMEFMNMIEGIKNRIEDMGMMNDEILKEIEESKKFIDNGDYSNAVEKIMKIREDIEKEKIEKLRKDFVEDTREILEIVGMEIPENIDSLGIEELRELRKKAIAKIGNKESEKDGIKGLVNVLKGAPENIGSIRDEIMDDIRELGELAGTTLPENLEDMKVEELKSVRKKIIETLKEGRKEEKWEYENVGHLLYEIGREDDILKMLEKQEDEYLDNAAGMIYFNKGEYEKAAEYFKRAIAINPDFKEAEFNLALSLHKLNKDKEARSHLKKIGMENYFKKM